MQDHVITSGGEKVYTIDGKLVKSQKLQSSEVDVELPNNETYIINLEDLRVKVRL